MTARKSTTRETDRLLDARAGTAPSSRAAAVDDYGTTSPPPPRSAKLSDAKPVRAGSADGILHSQRSASATAEQAEGNSDLESLASSTAEATPPAPSAAERRRTWIRFVVIWSVVAAVTIYLIVEAFRRGGGEFDWKGALRKAAGGGVAGAMAMVVQVLALMPLRTVMK